MKKFLLIVTALSFFFTCLAQDQGIIPKKGWNLGFLPAMAYDSDLNIFYGIIIYPFDFGDGSAWPNYLQSLYLQVPGYSKACAEHAMEHDSYSFLPSVRFVAKLKHVGYKAYPFYGYNGREAVYNPGREDTESPDYKTRMFYRIERKNIRFPADLQDTIGNSCFQWQIGWGTSH